MIIANRTSQRRRDRQIQGGVVLLALGAFAIVVGLAGRVGSEGSEGGQEQGSNRTEARILLDVGAASAFPSAGHLAAYAGLTPVTRRSGTSIRGEFPARSGNKHLKRDLDPEGFAWGQGLAQRPCQMGQDLFRGTGTAAAEQVLPKLLTRKIRDTPIALEGTRGRA